MITTVELRLNLLSKANGNNNKKKNGKYRKKKEIIYVMHTSIKGKSKLILYVYINK